MGVGEQMAPILRSIPYLLGGITVTLQLTVIALGTGALVGVILALVRVYGGSLPRFVATGYSRLVRSLPLLVILFFIYFLGARVLEIPVLTAAGLALALHTSAYQSEIFRGAIQSIPRGQTEAAFSLGMSRLQSIIYVVLPQALRRSIPAWGNEAAIVLKDTALAYALGVAELMRRGEYVAARTGEPLLTYLVVGAIYLAMTMVLTRGLSHLEHRVRIPE